MVRHARKNFWVAARYLACLGLVLACGFPHVMPSHAEAIAASPVVGFTPPPTASAHSADKAERPHLILVTEENAPANFTDPRTGILSGLATEKVRAVMAVTGFSHEFRMMAWKDAYAMTLANPQACIFLANLTDDRRDLFQWVMPLMDGGWALFGLNRFNKPVRSVADLKGMRIVVQTGSGLEAYLRAAVRGVPDVEIITVDEDNADVALLARGRADLLAGGLWTSPFRARQGEVSIQMVYRLVHAHGGLACNKGMPEATVAQLREALRLLTENGRVAAIEARYSSPGSWGGWLPGRW
jgi:polar amino acid transport system substrate-binding protein